MKKYVCPLCNSRFKTQEGFENHYKKDFIFTDYEGLVLKNKNKFFIFSYSNQISRKHEILYNLTPIRISQIIGDEKEKIIRKTHIKFPSSKIEKKILENRLGPLSVIEFNELNQFLEEINPKKEYYGKTLREYLRTL